ncbi:hypothetical protein [Microbacterium sp.]|uniref:hypothetical protein n=1 Tax=Microbacterium sp. TaxID=51671 RepID=UPI0028128A09|nr:hypothetical protein [Microbacterium sp.]
MNRKYSPEMRERALRMLAETRPSHPTMMSAVRHVAGLLGMSPERGTPVVDGGNRHAQVGGELADVEQRF